MMSWKIFSAFFAAISAALIFITAKPIFEVPQTPDLRERWWKISVPEKNDTTITQIKIKVSDDILEDLKYRLDKTLPLQKSLEGANQHYGMNDKLLADIINFWRKKYNWAERENFLNQYPHFKTNIQGLDIHFIHVKPSRTEGLKVLPLLLLHGWPGSIREFYEAIPLLTVPREGQDFVFELVIPSLPGCGFSDAAEIPGLNPIHVAIIFKNLMNRLGFQKYYVQGGDYSGVIVSIMATLFPEKITGMHSNLCLVQTPSSILTLALGSYFPSLVVEEKYQHLVYPLTEKLSNLILETGYLHIQATKPDTVGVALRESPVGLAAYIIEKFTSWTNPAWKDLEHGGLTKAFQMEALLDNVMIYWITRSITTSQRLYAEHYAEAFRATKIDQIPTGVPSSCARFERELIYTPESVLRQKFTNLIQSNHLNGGHFAALEVPETLVDDVIEFVGKVEKSLEKSK